MRVNCSESKSYLVWRVWEEASTFETFVWRLRIKQKARVTLFSPEKETRSGRPAVTDKEEVQPQFKKRKSSTAHAPHPSPTLLL